MKKYQDKEFSKFDFTNLYEYFENSKKEKSGNE